MPTARYGEALSQASIAACPGAWHWSNPSPVKLPGGTAVEIDYTSHSQADSANKALRLRNSAYLFFNNGTVAWITWWAPEGADVSALKRTVKTFKWQ